MSSLADSLRTGHTSAKTSLAFASAIHDNPAMETPGHPTTRPASPQTPADCRRTPNNQFNQMLESTTDRKPRARESTQGETRKINQTIKAEAVT
jgi:hypothetical protein